MVQLNGDSSSLDHNTTIGLMWYRIRKLANWLPTISFPMLLFARGLILGKYDVTSFVAENQNGDHTAIHSLMTCWVAYNYDLFAYRGPGFVCMIKPDRGEIQQQVPLTRRTISGCSSDMLLNTVTEAFGPLVLACSVSTVSLFTGTPHMLSELYSSWPVTQNGLSFLRPMV